MFRSFLPFQGETEKSIIVQILVMTKSVDYISGIYSLKSKCIMQKATPITRNHPQRHLPSFQIYSEQDFDVHTSQRSEKIVNFGLIYFDSTILCLTCSGPVASSAFLSSLTRMKRGKRNEIPLSSTYTHCKLYRSNWEERKWVNGRTKPCAAVYIGLRLKSAVNTSQTIWGVIHTSGFAPPIFTSPRGLSVSKGFKRA